ncbi:MAG: patatin-like phospholipase family protein [Fusobacteriota bacterium]
MSTDDKLALVLGGGSAWGLSHIGVIKRLEEANIVPDIIAGCSIGAMVGAFYCLGMPMKYLEQLAINFDYKKLLDFSMSRDSLLKGREAFELIKLLTANKNFKDTKIKFGVNAVEFKTGKEYHFTEGNIAAAVRASISIPFIFRPALVKGKVYVDGGVSQPLPIETAKLLGATRIISVGFSDLLNEVPSDKSLEKKMTNGDLLLDNITKKDLLKKVYVDFLKGLKKKAQKDSNHNYQYTIENMLSIFMRFGVSSEHKKSDFHMSPDVTHINKMNFYAADKLIKIGYEEADLKMSRLLKTIEKWNEE